MRHRAPRNLFTLLRLRRLRPRRRATGTAPGGRLGRPGLRLAGAVASVLAVLTAGLAAAQLGGAEVPAGGNAYADRAGPAEPSRSSGRTAWPAFDEVSTPSAPPPSSQPMPGPTSAATPDAPLPETTSTAGAEGPRSEDRSPLGLPSAQVSVTAAAPDVPTPSTSTGEPSSTTQGGTSGAAPDGPAAPRDRTPPQTTILSGPSATNGSALVGDPEFVFDASEDARFACSLDGGPFRPCDSPQEYDGLSPGRHEFAVRATDDAGNVDPTPDRHSWVTTGLDP